MHADLAENANVKKVITVILKENVLPKLNAVLVKIQLCVQKMKSLWNVEVVKDLAPIIILFVHCNAVLLVVIVLLEKALFEDLKDTVFIDQSVKDVSKMLSTTVMKMKNIIVSCFTEPIWLIFVLFKHVPQQAVPLTPRAK